MGLLPLCHGVCLDVATSRTIFLGASDIQVRAKMSTDTRTCDNVAGEAARASTTKQNISTENTIKIAMNEIALQIAKQIGGQNV